MTVRCFNYSLSLFHFVIQFFTVHLGLFACHLVSLKVVYVAVNVSEWVFVACLLKGS